jgi:hypothetical protein
MPITMTLRSATKNQVKIEHVKEYTVTKMTLRSASKLVNLEPNKKSSGTNMILRSSKKLIKFECL